MANSRAFTKFETSVARSITLIRNYRRLIIFSKNAGKKVFAPKDLIRASVVLSVAALDAYITDVFSEKLVPYLKKYKPDEELVMILQKSGLDTREALNLIQMDRPFRRIRNLVNKYYSTYTTQRFEVIDSLFLAYRLKNITKMAEKKSGRMTLKRSVELLIQRRHKIVHEGDYNSHNKLISIDEIQMKKRINDLKLLVKCLDEIICNRIK
jgi:hypothetical protein